LYIKHGVTALLFMLVTNFMQLIFGCNKNSVFWRKHGNKIEKAFSADQTKCCMWSFWYQ